MQILPVSYLEWGLCFFTIWFCWWKYGWNMDVIKGVRQMYKKLEEILIDPEEVNSDISTKNETSEMKHFKRIPTSGTEFKPRSKAKQCDNNNNVGGGGSHSFAALQENYVLDELMRPSSGPCFVCDSPTKAHVLDEIKKAKPLKNLLDFSETREASNPWYVRFFSDFLFWWRKWYLGQQYHVISLKEMMKDENLRYAISETAEQECKEKGGDASLEQLIEKHTLKVESIIRRMRAKQPAHPWYALYVRFASWIIGKFLAQIYPQILVRESQVELIHKARKSGHPILYLPVHKSHIDYVLISWSLVACDIRSPMVAAGENLNIPVFSLMMKSVGGFFIKRRFETKEGKKDVVYRTMIHSYMRKGLMSDNDMEFFIEGGRTRTGKPCLPKGGLLSIVMESLLTNKVDDILVVPVNFSYDRILEGNYIREQLGQPKVNESFASALMALFGSLQPKYGNARVDYGHPFSMKNFVLKHVDSDNPRSKDFSNSSSDSETGDQDKDQETSLNPNILHSLSHHHQRKLVEALGRHAIFEGVKCFTMTSTNAIAFLLLNKYRNGIDTDTLKKEMLELREELVSRGHDSAFTEDIDAAIIHGTKILGPTLINIEYKNGKKILSPVIELPNVIELSYYSNSVLPVFAMESIIATSVFKLLGDFCNNNIETNEQIKETELVATCLEYADVLHFEFLLCPPCQPVAQAVKKSIDFLSGQGVFSISKNENSERLLEIQSSQSLRRLVYLKNMLRPILDAYTTASHVFRRLVDHEAEEKLLQMDMLAEIKGQLQNKAILYGESMTLDPIRNLVSRAVQWQVLESHKKDFKNIYYLHDNFNNIEAVEEIIQRLEKLRV